ncbi:helix-turn-helix domain-containing protein [Salinadaptatus halalkaliphilus]|uniref:Helix-turn-helix domain-containing protein n=1 Tax=Salinadaptatus halalkaliphilus TaxID=2419781 RepID=A0A4S3TKK0_9EURY|nr:helix-turn-helix domain-containing protein [Salinadaptatus halalkaliphilus]THE63465.1 helix-turn-helix domain-containing protein [Salinadaptatus halalkaliphilus]
MKRVRLTLHGSAMASHPVFGPLTDPAVVDRAETLSWNVTDDGQATVLIRIEGDASTLAATFENVTEIETVEWHALEDGTTLAFVRDDGTAVSRTVLRSFTRDGLLVVPPVVYADAGVSFTVVGDRRALQTAMDAVPEGMTVDVREIGTPAKAVEPTSALSKRQLEAARAGLEMGYFDVPRRASHEDVAAELECAPSTAAEHLQRAQSKLVRASLSSVE